MELSRKAEKAKARAAYRSMFPASRDRRHKWRKLGKQPKCPVCRLGHTTHEGCPPLPRVVVIRACGMKKTRSQDEP